MIFPICLVALGGKLTTDRLFENANDMAEEIEEIKGISEVTIFGKRDRRIYVNVDPRKLESFGLTMNQVVHELHAKNTNDTAGHIVIGDHKIGIRLIGKYTNVEKFMDLVFMNKISGGTIQLKDFASIETSHEDAKTLTKLNGNPAIILEVKRKKKSNVMKIIDKIKEAIEDNRQRSFSNLDVAIFNDTSLEIRNRIGVLQRNSGMGMVLVFISLALFLGKRQAIFAFVGIPICFFATFILMRIFDLSIDGISLFALVLVLGMIVDDAIIVLENINRHLEKGMAKREAILTGVREVKWPITTAVLTSMAAFAPLLLVSGILGKFVSVIPKTIIFSLAASLFEVLFLMPSHVMEFTKVSGKKIIKHKEKTSNIFCRISLLRLQKEYTLRY